MRDVKPKIATPSSSKEGLRRRFIPPTRIKPFNPVKIEPADGITTVKKEIIEVVDDEEHDPITVFDGEESQDDIKPDIGLQEVKAVIPKVEGKRRMPVLPDTREVKPCFRGSKERPIAIRDDDDDDENERRLQRIPAQVVDPPRPIINNIIYNITYNIVNVIQPPPARPSANLPQSEIAPPAYAPLPGLGEPGPSGPPAGFPLDEAPVLPNVPFQPQPLPQIEPNPDMPVLSKAQKRILDTVLEGKSVLIHGSAGTGKSVLIRAIKQIFDQRYDTYYPHDPKPDPTAGGAVDRAKVTGDFSRLAMTAEERVMNPLQEKKWKLRVTASTGLAAVYVYLLFCHRRPLTW